jgi:DNA-binding LytR/AlgR family response regulator
MASCPSADPTPGTATPEQIIRARHVAPSCWCLRHRPPGPAAAGLRCLVVDGEPASRDELAAMLRGRACVARVATAPDAVEALRLVGQSDVDVAFVETRLPGLDGRDLAGVLGRLRSAPAVVLIVGRARGDSSPSDPGTVACLRRPVLPDRLTVSLRWAAQRRSGGAPCGPGELCGPEAEPASAGAPSGADVPVIPVEVGRTTRLVPLSAVRWAEACHDYVRLYTVDGCYLIRARLTALAETWQPYGDLVRIHRSYVVGLRFVSQLRKVRSGRFAVVVDGRLLPVSRRYLPKVRHRLPAPA